MNFAGLRTRRINSWIGSIRQMKVGLFVTCLNDTLFPEVGISTVRILERLGSEVEFPEDQTCCGQMHMNTGYPSEAKGLARRFVEVFADCEYVVTPSASCAAMIRHQYSRLDPGLGGFESRVFELTEFLIDVVGTADVGASFGGRVAFHPTCHSMRFLKVDDRPRQLLNAVRGLELVELANSNECCGFGGTFSVKNVDTSVAMLDDKIDSIVAAEAPVITAGDSSCLMHIGGALSRRRIPVRPLHLAEILDSTA